MKYNQSTLTRIERILGDVEYVIRYERGNFQSGYCILENKKVVVLNKFLPLDGRINALIDIIASLHFNQDYLTPESKKMYAEIMARYEETR